MEHELHEFEHNNQDFLMDCVCNHHSIVVLKDQTSKGAAHPGDGVEMPTHKEAVFDCHHKMDSAWGHVAVMKI